MRSVFLATALTTSSFCAQTQQVAKPEVDLAKVEIVSSIKTNNDSSNSMRWSMQDAAINANNVTLAIALEAAYETRTSLIFGLPDWAKSYHFNLKAKIVADADTLEHLNLKTRRGFVRTILADRFKLKVHMEKKDMPVYDLVIAKGGPTLKENTLPPAADGTPRGTIISYDYKLEATASNLGALATNLADATQRTVVDKTGLKGNYDFILKWTPDEQRGSDSVPTEQSPSIFTALQEQLGLKLIPSHGLVDTLVVDSIEHPAED